MPRYVVASRRDAPARDARVALARDAVCAEPGVQVLADSNPHVVTIEAPEDVAEHLALKLATTHHVEPEGQRRAHRLIQGDRDQ